MRKWEVFIKYTWLLTDLHGCLVLKPLGGGFELQPNCFQEMSFLPEGIPAIEGYSCLGIWWVFSLK